MNPSQVLLLAFLIGVIAGLRAMTAPAVVAWAANRHWLNLHNSPFAFMGSTAAVAIFTVLALGELVVDKLPSTPNRTKLLGLIGRSVTGGLCGAAVAASGAQSIALGAAGATGRRGCVAIRPSPRPMRASDAASLWARARASISACAIMPAVPRPTATSPAQDSPRRSRSSAKAGFIGPGSQSKEVYNKS